MPRVEATKPPPTCTAPLLVIAIPFGLTRYTWPLALSWPAMVEVVDPVTRLRSAEDASGWAKVTVLPRPIEKPFQLTIARGVVCVTDRLCPDAAIEAAPEA